LDQRRQVGSKEAGWTKGGKDGRRLDAVVVPSFLECLPRMEKDARNLQLPHKSRERGGRSLKAFLPTGKRVELHVGPDPTYYIHEAPGKELFFWARRCLAVALAVALETQTNNYTFLTC